MSDDLPLDDYELVVLDVSGNEWPFELRSLTSTNVWSGTLSEENNVVVFEELGLAIAYDDPHYDNNQEIAEVLGSEVESTTMDYGGLELRTKKDFHSGTG